MGKRKPWDTNLSGFKNNTVFMMYYTYLTNLLLSRYEWKNLPDSMNERFIELCLFEDGKAVFVNDELYGMLNLRYAESNTLNIYQEPEEINAYSLDYHKNYKLQDVALIYNNYTKTPDFGIVCEYALRLYDIRRTIDVNTRVQKTPLLMLCPDNKKLTLKNIYMQYDGNEPAIYGYKDTFNDTEFKVLKTDAPFIGNDMTLLFNKVLDEFMTRYGINNANTDKRERLITDEVNANNQLVQLCSDVGLLCRKQACEKFNKLYGTNIGVELRQEPLEKEYKEGDENEPIYD